MKQQLPALLKNCIPWRLTEVAQENLCEWLYTGTKSFTEPFFDDTIRACRILPENQRKYKCVSDLAALSSWGKQLSSTQPAAVIFHISRCGSTLLSQLLCCSDRNIVLSEVPFIDELLRLKFKGEKYTQDQIDEYVKAAIGFYGITDEKQRLFIKTDSWHLYFYKQYRKLYPDSLFVLLYREPFAVIQSQKKQRGLHAVPEMLEPELFGLTITEKHITNFDVYMADVLKAYYEQMLIITSIDKNVLLVNYEEGMLHIIAKLYNLLELWLDEEANKLLEERSRYHAKRTDQIFSKEKSLEEHSPYIQHCFTAYKKLEQMRQVKN